MIPKEISTNRLSLVVLQNKDAVATFTIWSDLVVTKFMNIQPFEHLQQAEEMIAFFEKSLLEETAVRYGIFFQGSCIGSCGFNQFNWETGETEIGYELAKEYWHQGFGSEIVEILCQIAFQKLNINKIKAIVEEGNQASQKLLEKQGFKFTSRTKTKSREYTIIKVSSL